jgi:hypothetical protein
MRWLAAFVTVIGFVTSGFDAHVAPLADGRLWHGVTGGPTFMSITGALAAGALIWMLGRAADVRPLVLMAAGLLPFVPATTGRAVAFLAFTQNFLILLFATLVVFCARDLIERLSPNASRAAFPVAFAFFLLVGRFLPGPAGPQGDEPHYLLIAESLLTDGDVDLANQFENRAFTKFTSADLDPHTAPRSPEGTMYSIHTPGVAALVAPGYMISGYAGARVVMSATLALTIALLALAAREILGTTAGNVVFLLATFATPLPVYANAIFPDPVAALPVAATLAYLAAGRASFLALASIAIAALPWLHPRFLPLGAGLCVALALRGGFDVKRASLAFFPLGVSLALLLVHFQSIFDEASISAAYGPGFASDVSITRIPWGATALILDRQFGLLLFAPALLIGLPGVASLMRKNFAAGTTSAFAVVVALGVGGSFSMWWGGASAPARFLISATPAMLLLSAARFTDETASKHTRSLLTASAGFGAGLLWLACLAPRALHNRSDGESGLLRLITPAFDLDRFFPGFVAGSGYDNALALLWLTVMGVALVRPRHAMWLSVAPFAVGSLIPAAPALDPFAASLRVLESWHDRRQAFVPDDEDDEKRFELEIPRGATPWNLGEGVKLYSPRFSLPAGEWKLILKSSTEPKDGVLNVARASLVSGDESRGAFASTLIELGRDTAEVSFRLAAPEQRLHLKLEGLQWSVFVHDARLRPVSLDR